MNSSINPYIGPRAFEQNETIYGRDHEIRTLISTLIAERIVLLQSPSGAGKTSLIQAGIIPQLREENFDILPIIRVNLEPPANIQSGERFNRYVYSTLISLEEDLPPEKRLSTEILANLTLDEYLSQRPRVEDSPISSMLVFDQFEEILTVSTSDRNKKEQFFTQLGAALRNNSRWALFAIRDDYLGAIQPHQRPIPNRFDVVFRLERLGAEAARQAIQKPARDQDVDFTDEAAQKLVDDLRAIQVQLPDGSLETQLGQFVEPVQLQVVCYRLWQTRTIDSQIITEADVATVGDVDQSLSDFYATSVEAIAQSTGVNERLIRDWFDQKLITKEGLRNQVLMRQGSSEGLDNRVIRLLENNHIVRAEKRGGATWFELSHDRLIAPVRKNNAAWAIKNLDVLQRQAALWAQQGRSDGLLIFGNELLLVEKQLGDKKRTQDELDFLEACRKERASRQREKFLNRAILALAILMFFFMVAAGMLAFWGFDSAGKAVISANDARQQAEKAQAANVNAQNAKATAQASEQNAKQQAEKALAGSLAAQASSQMNSDYPLALLLAVEAYQRESSLLTRTTLFDLLRFVPFTRLYGHSQRVNSLAVSADGRLMASSSCKEYSNTQCKQGEVILWDANTRQIKARLDGSYGTINSLAFSPDGKFLASGGCVGVTEKLKGCIDNKGQIMLWDIQKPGEPVVYSETDGHAGLVKSVAFSPDSKMLASGSFDRSIILWDVTPGAPQMRILLDHEQPLIAHASFVNAVVFALQGKFLVTAGDDREIKVWDVSNPAKPVVVGKSYHQQTEAITSLAFSPNGSQLASGSDDHSVVLWQWHENRLENPQVLLGHTGSVRGVAFGPDGSQLASAGFDNSIILWNTANGKRIGPPLLGHTKTINSIAIGSGIQAPYLISGSDDRTLILWDIAGHEPISQPINPDGLTLIAKQSADGPENLHASVPAQGQEIVLNGAQRPLLGHTGTINSLDFNSSRLLGKLLLASASDDQTVIVWDVSQPANPEIFLKLEDFGAPVSVVSWDGSFLLTGDKEGRFYRWMLNPEAWTTLACSAVKRNLSQQEWNDYLTGQPYRKTCPENPAP